MGCGILGLGAGSGASLGLETSLHWGLGGAGVQHLRHISGPLPSSRRLGVPRSFFFWVFARSYELWKVAEENLHVGIGGAKRP